MLYVNGGSSVGVISGMGLPIVGALLGHKTPTVTARYAHLFADPLKVAADRISGQDRRRAEWHTQGGRDRDQKA
ncbi:MAG: hypothetical protein G8237_11035 [Magnetococcales bacterium]|nr:hypothetical protein [Magnetococcales bacterium]NGZ06877.1 hypothetical protein [Magnetococcales bacterium]